MRSFVALALLGLLACSGEDKPAPAVHDCQRVGDRFVTLARSRSDREARALEPMLPKLRRRLIGECRKQRWPKSARQCFIEATTARQAHACAPAPPVHTKSP